MRNSDLKQLAYYLENTIEILVQIAEDTEHASKRKSKADRYVKDRAIPFAGERKVVYLSDALQAIEMAWRVK